MQVEIIAIGEELLCGHITNSNAAFMSRLLCEKGYEVSHHQTIQDDAEQIQKKLQEALERVKLVFVTGGLGPTLDDKTRQSVCEMLGLDLEFEENIAKDLQKRYTHLSSLQNQASIPKGAKYFLNRIGTAPGVLLQVKNSFLFLLPGVPEEMKEMFSKDVLPFLEKNFPLQEKLFAEKIFLGPLDEIDVDPLLQQLQKKHPHVQFGIYPAFGNLQIHLKTKAPNQSEATKIILPVKEKIIEQFQEWIFSYEQPSIAFALHEALSKKFHYKIAFAESCTGGALASSITAIPGASKYFLGSIVCYANDWKRDFLNVSEKTLQTQGAVSLPTIQEMIQGVFSKTEADFAVAISGIAGPSGGSKEKPVGTIFLGIGKKDGFFDGGKIEAKGNRETIITYSVQTALFALWKNIVYNQPFFKK